MPDTSRTLLELQSIFPDNSTGLISPQDIRDFLVSVYYANQNNLEALYIKGDDRTDGSIRIVTGDTGEVVLQTRESGVFVNATIKIKNIKATNILDVSIYAQLNSSVNQEPADTNPTTITYNIQDAIAGLTHSTTVNPGEITVDTAGIYFISPQPQVGKNTGGVKVDFDMFLQVDRGSGFADEANSNIKLTIKDADRTDVIVSAFTLSLNAGHKVRMMQKVSSTDVGMGLKNTDPIVGPPTIPRTPSIIFTMYRVGGI